MSNAKKQSPENPSEPWRRLWLPTDVWDQFRGIDADFLSDHGGRGEMDNFLEAALPGIGRLSDYGSMAFLTLLGRPGAGKSWELSRAEQEGWLGERSLYIEGKEFGSTNAAVFLESVYGKQLAMPCRLIIDGLDEILLTNSQFVAQLKCWFRGCLDERMRPLHRLAIASRWADWQESQIADLANLWPTEESKTLVLAPLIESDAAETLIRRLGEKHADEFWKQLRDLHLRPAACWPQGLLAMIGHFKSTGFEKIAPSHADAIKSQVLSLCKLTDSPDDALRWEQSVPRTNWRRRIAGRIAATMIVSGRAQLMLAETTPPIETNALSCGELGATEELWESQRITPKLEDLDAVVHRTGLMRRLPSSERWVFESQVHQEWLAADWLTTRKLDVKKLVAIFGSEAEGHWMVAPRMRATAAWLARDNTEFRNWVLKRDPLALLAMDGACLPDREREEIVEAILEATQTARVRDPAIRHSHLPSLMHPRLADQLERWLGRLGITDAARHLAIELAEKTNLHEIGDVLWRIYPTASKSLRPQIAGGLHRLAASGHDEKWKAVLNGGIPIDAHGNLLGAALNLMVIEFGKIPVCDVIDHLLPCRSFEVFGLYESVAAIIHEHMAPEDLPVVFGKLVKNPHALHGSFGRVQAFNEAALRLAFQKLHDPIVREALVDYWQACLEYHVVPLAEQDFCFKLDPGQRLEFVRLLVSHSAFERNRKRGWVDPAHYLLEEQDFGWCLEELKTSPAASQWRYAMLAASMVWRVDLANELSQQLDAAWADCASLRDMLPAPETGESASIAIRRIAAENRKKHESKRHQATVTRTQREQAHRERMAKEAADCREAHESGQSVWPRVFRILLFRNTMSSSGIVSFAPISEIGPDDAWMRESAARFITDSPSHADFGCDYGLHGLLALAACADKLTCDVAVRSSVEKHWLSHLIPLLCNHGLGDPPKAISNQRFAADFADTFTRAFGRFTRDSYRKDGSLSELHHLLDIQLPALITEMKTMLMEEPIRPAGFFTGMWFLSNLSLESAIQVALRWLPELDESLAPDAMSSLLGTSAILVNGRLSAEIESHLRNTSLLGEAIRGASSRLSWHEREIDFSAWPDHAIKTLGDATWRAFPFPDRHHKHGGTFEFHGMTAEDHAMEFRDRLSAAAWSRGIDLAIPEVVDGENREDAALRRHMIDWHLYTNRQARTAAAWKTMEPIQFLKFADRPHARLARDSGELLDAVIESLERWECAMTRQGTWDHLWNFKISKPENRIAIAMRDWLKHDLETVVEREVELASGGRPDVMVETLPADGSPNLTVVIELKKHLPSNVKDRRTAMKSQLVDRYLRERLHDGWTHGLYVVAWTPKPGSRADSDHAIERARREFEQQADSLSIPPFTVKSMVIDARYRG